MKQKPQTRRAAIVALSASVALFNAPVYGQETAPVIAPPPPPTAAAPAPIAVTPSPVATPAPRAAPAVRATPPAAEAAPRRATRVAERARTPVRAAPAAAPSAAPRAAAEPAAVPVPVAETPAPAPVAEPAAPEATSETTQVTGSGSSLTWLIAGGAAILLALIGLFAWRRRRAAAEDYYYEEPYEQVVTEPAPAAAYEPGEPDYQPQIVAPSPSFRRAEEPAETAVPVAADAEMELGEASKADMEALAASSAPEGHRPWLEFLMRPVRAGTDGDEALVEFELTIGNTGTAAAEDVRISTWMFASDANGSEMERSLIDPPADAATSETRIAPGDGTRVDATIAVPRDQLAGDRLPVVVADARYRLPNGGEGRTAARFAVGLPSGDGLAPFAVALGDGLREDVEVRLAGEPEHA